MGNEKVKIDWGGARGAAWMGASGIIGLFVDAALRPGGLLDRFGGGQNQGGATAAVSREVADLMAENTMLKANAHADAMNSAQIAWNSRQEERIGFLKEEVDRLYTLTRLTIPNWNLTPGVGPVAVVPVAPPAPQPANPPSVSLDSDTIAAIAAAVKAAA